MKPEGAAVFRGRQERERTERGGKKSIKGVNGAEKNPDGEEGFLLFGFTHFYVSRNAIRHIIFTTSVQAKNIEFFASWTGYISYFLFYIVRK